MKKFSLIALVLATLGPLLSVGRTAESTSLPLGGQWRFQLDRADVGEQEGWFGRALPERIKLPGGLTEQGIGDAVTTNTAWIGGIVDKSWFTAPEYAAYREPGNVKVPFWLQPELYYAGAAWFQRDFTVPQDWAGQRVVLHLERPHWETRVWVNGTLIGTNNALATPHEYDLGQLAPGKHSLTLRVDNRMILDIGENSHSVSDHTQGNWNGVVGRIELRATPLVWIEEVQVYPNAAQKAARVSVKLGNQTGKPVKVKLGFGVNVVKRAPFDAAQLELDIPAGGGAGETTLSLGKNAPLWDEFNPTLHELKLTLTTDTGATHTQQTRFGLRDIATDGTQITINGRETFLRGTLECAIFPKTGHPPTDVAEWKRIIRVAQAHGLNHLRFHSWCPPEAAFVAADELGMYLQVECSSWANQSTTLGDGKPVDAWIYAEADRILKAYGNHPSFVLFLFGNEPGGPKHKQYLAKWTKHYQTLDSRRLVGSGAGWPEIPESQLQVLPQPRVQQWGQGVNSRINARPPETTTDYREFIGTRNVPVISHEIGQWCVYPNFAEIKKYTGYLKARNFEIFRDRLAASGLGALGEEFLFASGKLQALCYKEDIESALRTPGMGGFQLLDLHDFPGQGTALVGVLDPFWEEKGYITAKEYSRFCNSVVPLARLPQRVFTSDEKLTAELEVANFGAATLPQAVVTWKLTGARGKVLARGELPPGDVAVGNGVALGKIAVELRDVPAPQQCKLVVGVANTKFENDWDVWIYPPPGEASAGEVLVTAAFDEIAQQKLAAGGKVLLTLPAKSVRNFDHAPVKPGFSSIFWNTAWTDRQAPTTLGILCDPKHPALAQFPTESFSNWQWWYLIHRAGALRLDGWPRDVKPIVRVIDDWVTARSLGLIIEAQVSQGKIVVCGFDLTSGVNDPVSRQMRASLLAYMSSKRFRPTARVDAAQVSALIAVPKEPARRDMKATASSAQPDHEAELAIDGDLTTMWHTPWQPNEIAFPHDLVLELKQSTMVSGFRVSPRQDGNRNGMIRDYEIYLSADGVSWGEPVAKGVLPADVKPQEIRLAVAQTARFVKLTARSGHAAGPWAAVAEFEIINAP
jgi:hypothetical protein